MIDAEARPLPARVDVAIIGGGTAGCSAALHLRRRGLSVLLFERRLCGSQASGVNYGGVRQQGRHPAEIALSSRARALWDSLPELVGHACEFEATGHLKLARTEAEMAELEAWAAMAGARGIATELLSGNALRARYDYLGQAVYGGSLCPSDGQANPRLVAPYFARAAEAAGADLREHCAVARAERAGQGEDAGFRIELADGRSTRAGALVNTAGAWGAEIAAQFGEPVDEGVMAPNMLVTEPVGHRIRVNFGICGGDVYLRQIAQGSIIFGGGRGWADRDAIKARPLAESSRSAARALLDLMPLLRQVRVLRSWTGLEGVMPDQIPVVGPSRTTPNLFHAFGFSGHGFQLGPAVGAVLSELVVDGHTPTDIAGLAIDRLLPDGAAPPPGASQPTAQGG